MIGIALKAGNPTVIVGVVAAAVGSVFGFHWARGVTDGKTHPDAIKEATQKTGAVIKEAAKVACALNKIKKVFGG
jgi:hypothetical protein